MISNSEATEIISSIGRVDRDSCGGAGFCGGDATPRAARTVHRSPRDAKSRAKAEALVEQYFATAALDDSPLYDLYDEAFYRLTPRDQWKEIYAATRSRLGKPTRHTLASWQVRTNVGAGGNGYFVTLVYNVEYEKASGVETIGVFVPLSTTTATIQGHRFNSDALLK